jgi:hypothetical protein
VKRGRLNKRTQKDLKSVEMKLERCAPGCSSLHHTRNEDILEETKIDAIEKKLAHYKHKWLNNFCRTEVIRYPKQQLDY